MIAPSLPWRVPAVADCCRAQPDTAETLVADFNGDDHLDVFVNNAHCAGRWVAQLCDL